jgi:tetratricopeptide (TPR) repeat protein
MSDSFEDLLSELQQACRDAAALEAFAIRHPPAGLCTAGDDATRIERLTQVIDLLQNSTSANEFLSQLLVERASLFAARQDPVAQLADLQRAFKHYRWLCREPLLDLGHLLSDRGDQDGAIAAYTTLIESYIGGWESISGLHYLLSELWSKRDYDGILDCATELAMDGGRESLLERAEQKLRLGDLVGALADFRCSLNKPWDYSDGSDEYFRRRFKTDVGLEVEQALQMQAEGVRQLESRLGHQGYYSPACHKELHGELQEALNLYSESIEREPGNTRLYEDRARAYRKAGRLEEAISDWSTVISAKPFLAIPYERRGSLYFSLRNFPEAIRDFDRALEISPELRDRSRILRVLSLLRMGKRSQEIPDLQTCDCWTVENNGCKSGIVPERIHRDLTLEPWFNFTRCYLLGHISELDFLHQWKARKDPETAREYEAKALFVAATRRLISGDAETARQYFRRSAAAFPAYSMDHFLALEQLR